ncbi:MAG: hypothetical protein C9356_14850 [Oleiphilus sp.]|nr:MAG: hypothetical protein C9356_14850 [Oleiphilus sp.]
MLSKIAPSKNETISPTKKDIYLIIAVCSITVCACVLINSVLPIEVRAKKYAFGLFSRLDFVGYGLIATAGALAFEKRLRQAAMGVIFAILIFIWSYYFAFELAKNSSPETFSLSVHQELGCFPDQWVFMLEKHELKLWDKAILCSKKSGS